MEVEESKSLVNFNVKTEKRKKSDNARKDVRSVLAPFLRRMKKQGTQKLESKVNGGFQKLHLRSKIKDVIANLQAFCKDCLEVPKVLNETSEILKDVTKSVGVSSYIVDESNKYLILNAKYLPQNNRHTVRYKIEPGQTVASFVAYTQEFVMSDDILGDSRFPLGIPGANKTIKSVICVPIVTAIDGKCIAIIELFRDMNQKPYSSLDLQICISMTVWMGVAIHQNKERLFLMKKSELNNYLVSLVNFFFTKEINFDKFVSDIVECAKLSVQAERGSFYIMPEEIEEGTESEIVADVYEEGLDSQHYTFKKKNKQRFFKNSTGFAGQVARSGKVVNLRDVYNDSKGNRVHEGHGIVIKSVISVPIKGSKGVLGVLQLVNKVREPYFTTKDEILLKNIAGYAYLACQHSNLRDRLRRASFRCEGIKELVKIQMKPCPDDLRYLQYLPIYTKSDMPKGFFTFKWIITGKETNAPNYAVFMFSYLLGDLFFDYYKLTEFILTVKKSYRNNPYHNFYHAFTVCHCMFNIVYRNKECFTKLQILGLLIATICHDSDHVGFTNNFLEMTNHWLSELYWESPLEHHHYDMCLLMIEGTELFANMNDDEIIEIQKLIKHLILSTDLVQFFRNRSPILNIIKSGIFDWKNQEHQYMFLGMAMTVCDVSGQCKPFYSAKKVTEGLYREFYYQGDLEKNLGFSTLAMMDREKTSTIPENQIQFLSLVCIPSVEILVTIFPNTQELLRQCVELKEYWSDILEKKVIEVWKIDQCIVNNKAKRRSSAYKLKKNSAF